MRYHHSNLIGNEGDTVKHALVVAAISRLARAGRDFTYIESHAAFSAYELRDGGRWTGGIGSTPWADMPEPVSTFASLHGQASFIAGDRYFGSHVWARRAAEAAGARFLGWGCDINPDAPADAVAVHGDTWTVRLTDGLPAVIRHLLGGGGADLVVLDPIFPHEDEVAIVWAVELLLAAHVPFVLWMARVRDRAYGVPCDVRYELVFDRLAALAPSATILHPSPGSTTGMQLVVSPDLGDLLDATADAFCAARGW